MEEKKAAFAVVQSGGKQYIVKVGDRFKIEKIDASPGDEVTLSEVLMVKGEGESEAAVGAPHIEGASVTARVLALSKEKKVIIFKKKKRKGYMKKQGHRQQLTELVVESVNCP